MADATVGLEWDFQPIVDDLDARCSRPHCDTAELLYLPRQLAHIYTKHDTFFLISDGITNDKARLFRIPSSLVVGHLYCSQPYLRISGKEGDSRNTIVLWYQLWVIWVTTTRCGLELLYIVQWLCLRSCTTAGGDHGPYVSHVESLIFLGCAEYAFYQ